MQDKFPVATYFSSIVLYGITIWCYTSEYFPVRGFSIHLYDCVIKCHNTRADMSEIPSMSWHLDDNMPCKVFNVHTNLSIDTRMFTCKIRTYNIKHFFCHVPYCARSECIISPLIDLPLI